MRRALAWLLPLALFYGVLVFCVMLAQRAPAQTVDELAHSFALSLPDPYTPELFERRKAVLLAYAKALRATAHAPKRVELECPASDPLIYPAVTVQTDNGQRLKFYINEPYGGPMTVWIHEGYQP